MAPSTSVAVRLAVRLPPSSAVPVTLKVPMASSSRAVTFNVIALDALSWPSEAMMTRPISPVKFCGGVPENVCVNVLKDSQSGKGSPLARVALKVSKSPSTSMNMLAGMV